MQDSVHLLMVVKVKLQEWKEAWHLKDVKPHLQLCYSAPFLQRGQWAGQWINRGMEKSGRYVQVCKELGITDTEGRKIIKLYAEGRVDVIIQQVSCMERVSDFSMPTLSLK